MEYLDNIGIYWKFRFLQPNINSIVISVHLLSRLKYKWNKKDYTILGNISCNNGKLLTICSCLLVMPTNNLFKSSVFFRMCTTTIVYYRYESYSIYVYYVYSFVRACMRNITKEKKSAWRIFFCWQVIASWWKVSSRLLHLLFVIRFFYFFTIHRCVYMRLFLWKCKKMFSYSIFFSRGGSIKIYKA